MVKTAWHGMALSLRFETMHGVVVGRDWNERMNEIEMRDTSIPA